MFECTSHVGVNAPHGNERERVVFRTYCPVHRRYIAWDALCAQIIDTPEFQRLRHVRQLGACQYVFTSATHTRFEHSLGVGYLVSRVLEQLATNQPELVLSPRARRCLRLAGLCHDLGHGPFSHVYDKFLAQARRVQARVAANGGRLAPPLDAALVRHEARSVWVLRHLVARHRVPLAPEDLDDVAELIDPRTRHLPPFWYQLISNVIDGIDVDKLDYLQRDAQMLGLTHAGVDSEKFCVHARVVDDRLCYPRKMRHDIRRLFETRAELHATVYQHATVKCVEAMLIEYMHAIAPALMEAMASPERYCELTDGIFSAWYARTMPAPTAERCTRLLERVATRDLYRVAADVVLSRPAVAVEAARGNDREAGEGAGAGGEAPTLQLGPREIAHLREEMQRCLPAVDVANAYILCVHVASPTDGLRSAQRVRLYDSTGSRECDDHPGAAAADHSESALGAAPVPKIRVLVLLRTRRVTAAERRDLEQAIRDTSTSVRVS
jgi:HD superfamily phosphohydrolase